MLFIVIVFFVLHHRENKVTFFSSVKLCILCGELNSKVVPKRLLSDYLHFTKTVLCPIMNTLFDFSEHPYR